MGSLLTFAASTVEPPVRIKYWVKKPEFTDDRAIGVWMEAAMISVTCSWRTIIRCSRNLGCAHDHISFCLLSFIFFFFFPPFHCRQVNTT